MSRSASDTLSKTRDQTRDQTKQPPRFKVLLLNDDYTPMDFVVEVLMHCFRKGETEAVEIMLSVHQQGVGVCGVYPFEVAETKVEQVMSHARREGHPLRCVLEPE